MSIWKVECKICFEPCLIPVSFTCFPCNADPGTPSCNSMTRVCLQCARKYLELDRPRRERSLQKRCILCRAVTNPRRLNAVRSYTKDYLLMTLDPRMDYECVHSECSFRGTQMEMDHHIRSDCVFRDVHCNGCHTYIRSGLLQAHVRSECPGYIQCRYCDDMILQISMDGHLSSKHQIIRCMLCNMFVHQDFPGMQTHLARDCPLRVVQCVSCGASVIANELKTHYNTKIEWVRSHIRTLEAQLKEYTFVLENYRKILYDLETCIDDNMKSSM